MGGGRASHGCFKSHTHTHAHTRTHTHTHIHTHTHARTHTHTHTHTLSLSLSHTLSLGSFYSIDSLPYGVRWLCKTIRCLCLEKFESVNKDVVHSHIGGFLLLRYINPAIVSPEVGAVTVAFFFLLHCSVALEWACFAHQSSLLLSTRGRRKKQEGQEEGHTHTYTYAHSHACTHAHTHTHIHTHTHTHPHTLR